MEISLTPVNLKHSFMLKRILTDTNILAVLEASFKKTVISQYLTLHYYRSDTLCF